jgi:beta-glucuronidase
MRRVVVIWCLMVFVGIGRGEDVMLIGNTADRPGISLDGQWQVIVDRYDEGLTDYLSRPKEQGWWVDRDGLKPWELHELSFDDRGTLEVPGDWNTQRDELFFYEGIVWYRRTFDAPEIADGERSFLCFGGANKRATVWLNGVEVARHDIGFTPFHAEVTGVIRPGTNVVHVRVDNTRRPDGVPGMKTDWWNYGGLTRSVRLIVVPDTFVRDIEFDLESTDLVRGVIRVDRARDAANADAADVRLVMPGLGIDARLEAGPDGSASFELRPGRSIQRWSPENPVLYEVQAWIGERILMTDRVGFRTIETDGGRVLLNGEPIVFRGVSIHEEAMSRRGRATGVDDARELLSLAKELGCNMVRLAHYTHNEAMVRMADELGLLVWSEIPVYWTLEYENPATLEEAKLHLGEMIERDHNRASIVVWSIGNETGEEPVRTAFRLALGEEVRRLDPSRLLSAAMFARQIRAAPGYGRDGSAGERLVGLKVDDPFGAMADILAINLYAGWYHDRPDEFNGAPVELAWDKPFMISEFGAGVKQGLRGEQNQRWTEEYGAWLYENTLAWSETLPNFAGMTPWILKDFLSPRRPLHGIQDWYNRKGLVSETGIKKDVFGVLQRHYQKLAAEQAD